MSPFLLAFINLSTRLDWGFGNPNKTAASIATLMIAVWGFAYLWRKGFWISLAAFAGLGFCLLLTLSRGGVVALLAGLIPLLAFAPRPWPRRKMIAIAAVLIVQIAAAIAIEGGDRFVKGISEPDLSISNRLLIWGKVPKMMVDAPGGWGLGNSGRAYMQWYQGTEQTEGYRTLVSSHLTWMVEFGWWGRFWYLVGWFAVLAISWPRGNRLWLSVATGVWVAFGIAAAFSSVAESTWLWGIPCLLLLLAILSDIRNRTFVEWKVSAAITSVSVIILVGVVLVGTLDHRSSTFADRIHFNEGRVIVGEGIPKTWVIPDLDVMGEGYGKDIRRSLEKLASDAKSIGLVSSVSRLPRQRIITIITGGTGKELGFLKEWVLGGSRLVLINPTFSPRELEFDGGGAVQVFVGEFSRSATVFPWRTTTASVTEISGTGDYWPSWAALILNQG